MPDVLKEYLLKLKKEQSKNSKIKVDNVIAYADVGGAIPTMMNASSYLQNV
jgi:hypothetical protein